MPQLRIYQELVFPLNACARHEIGCSSRCPNLGHLPLVRVLIVVLILLTIALCILPLLLMFQALWHYPLPGKLYLVVGGPVGFFGQLKVGFKA